MQAHNTHKTHQVLGDGAVAQVPVVAVVEFPQRVVVALARCGPGCVQLVLAHERGQDLGVQVVLQTHRERDDSQSVIGHLHRLQGQGEREEGREAVCVANIGRESSLEPSLPLYSLSLHTLTAPG